MKQAFRSARVRAERACTHRFCTQSNDRTHRQIEFLGRARFYADGRPGDVALRGEYALSRTDRAGRHAIHSGLDRKSTRLNSSHSQISYAVFCLKKKKEIITRQKCV